MKRFSRFLLALSAAVGTALLWLSWDAVPAPTLEIAPRWSAIGPRTPVAITVHEPKRGVGRVEVRLVHAGGETVLADDTDSVRPWWKVWGDAPRPDLRLDVDVGSETVEGLKSGTARLRVTAERSGTWLRQPDPTVIETEMPVRLEPPSLSIASSHHYVTQGGAEAVVYRVGEHTAAHGVRAGDHEFPGALLPGPDPTLQFALFSAPWNLEDPEQIRLWARDELGNEIETAFVDRWKARPPRQDTIRLSDGFFRKVVPEIVARSDVDDSGDLLETYLVINRDLRRRNADTLRALATESAGRFLWNRPFRQLSNTQAMAAFADERTYVYEGRDVDHQVHLGFDLASVRRAPVEAANSGRVVLAEYLGIYGNTVVLDHGFGLMTLYAHLSSLEAEVGQDVERGQSVGRTGETGLAGGDHLHFSVLLHGLEVDPAEWWDPHWLRDRIETKLAPGFELED